MANDELALLRAQLKAEEEANEVLSLRAELAKVQQERSQLLQKTTTPTTSKKSKQQRRESGQQKNDSNKKRRVVRSWQELVRETTASERFRVAWDALPKEKDQSSLWARAKPCGEWCKGRPHAYAIDCEMCVSKDPVTEATYSRELVRFSVVDNEGVVTLDSLVSPSLPVVDYVTRIHGIDEAALSSVTFTRRHAQAALVNLFCAKTVLVGHAICNDLDSLKFHHDQCVDTSVLYKCPDDGTPGLKDVASAVLGAEQYKDLVSNAHDPRVDAKIALLCAKHLLHADPGESLPLVVPRLSNATTAKKENDDQNKKIFAHRIPADRDAEAVTAAFEVATGLKVVSAAFIPGTPYSKCTFTLKSIAHADLAFDSLGAAFEDDKQGRPQKKLFLNNATVAAGPYCKLRRL